MNKFVLKGTLKFDPRPFPSNNGVSFVIEVQAEGRQYPDSITVTAFDEVFEAIRASGARQGDYVEVMGRIAERKSERINERTGKPLYELQAIATGYRMGAPA